MPMNRRNTQRRAIGHGLVIAGLQLQIAILLKLLSPDTLSAETVQRILGVMSGSVLVFYANAVPKTVLSCMRNDPLAEQALRRFVGWTLALGGVGYVVSWLLLPFDSVKGISASFLGATLLVVIVRLSSIWSERSRA